MGGLMPGGRQSAVLVLIVLLHVGFFYALQAGLMRKASNFVQEEVVARLILPDPPVEPTPPPPPPPPPPKVVATPPPPPPTPRETVKPVDTPPPPTAITLPAAPPEPPPKPAEPAPVVVAPGPPDPAPPPPVVAAPPPPPAQPVVRSIGDAGIEYIRAPQASYPQISMRLRETGELLLRVLVNEQGKVEKVEVQKPSGFPRLDNAAREAASRAVFKPYLDGGRAVPVWVVVPFSFKLDS
jgi:protein TonB